MRNSLPSTLLLMNDETFDETTGPEEGRELLARRLFLQSMGKWSGAAIAAAVFGGAWLAFPPEATATKQTDRRGAQGVKTNEPATSTLSSGLGVPGGSSFFSSSQSGFRSAE